MPIDPSSDITFEELIASYSHTKPGSFYFELFEEARLATSLDDKRRNQTIKYLRQAGLFHCAQSVLKSGPRADFAECGCFRGQAAYMIAKMIQEAGSVRQLHLFDSFEGLSEFAEEDNAGLTRQKHTTENMRRHFVYPETSLRHNMEGFDFVRVYRGWIPERFAEVDDREFALVHIDVDLYQPTLDSLRFFYPRLAPRGWIIVDDYNAQNFPGANIAVDRFIADVNPSCAIAGQVGGFFISK